MNRRQWVRSVAYAGVGAAGAGLGTWAWWRSRPPLQEVSGAPPDAQAGASDLPWSLRLERPEGGWLEMSSFRGRPLVLNFWATWCPPCVHELPDLDRFRQQFRPRGWEVVGLAVDAPTPVRAFLARQPLSFPVALAGLAGTDLSRELGNQQGSLPFTVVFDRNGQVARRKMGQTDLSELSAWASALP